jgi:hypothetical protein
MLFATVEALTFVAKRYVLSAESRGEVVLAADDHACLEDGEIEDRLAATMTRGARFRRNQFVHPKSVDSLRVSGQDLNHLAAILAYYKQALNFMHLEQP